MIKAYVKSKGRWFTAASLCLMVGATIITWGMAKENLPKIGFVYVLMCYIIITWLNIILGMKMERNRPCRS